ncbi:hypothetical protein WOLCODRAFT_60368, partial [Wolfiporia cocos MD-104 SS10]
SDVLKTHPNTTVIHYFTNNTTALRTIYSTHNHPTQTNSILFITHTDSLLCAHPNLTIILHWCPSHKGIPGNKSADCLAKHATTLPSSHPSTLTWLRQHVKRQALQCWQREFHSTPNINRHYTHTLFPPSNTLHPTLRKFTGTRNVQSRIIHCITAQGHFSEYYSRFVPTETTSCPCDTHTLISKMQTLISTRHHLTRISPSITLHILLSTPKGLQALQRFLEHSTAFLKT